MEYRSMRYVVLIKMCLYFPFYNAGLSHTVALSKIRLSDRVEVDTVSTNEAKHTRLVQPNTRLFV